MGNLGYDAADNSTDTTTPTGIGNVAAQAVLDFHHGDGANQLGNEPGGAAGVPYSDYTGYVPANDTMDIRVPFDPGTVHDPNAWQPLRYVDGAGAVVTPGFVGAQWQHVTTFAVSPGSLRSSTGPARYGSPEYLAQAQALIETPTTAQPPWLRRTLSGRSSGSGAEVRAELLTAFPRLIASLHRQASALTLDQS